MKRNNRQSTYQLLREKHPQFFYHGFEYQISSNSFDIQFDFSMGDAFHFHPKHSIQRPQNLEWQSLPSKELDQLVFHLGMVEVISYWKASCSPTLVIKSFLLNEKQISWWKKLYFQGLGEFFYLNGLNPSEEDFMQIICESEKPTIPFVGDIVSDKVMVPVGGGKDSVVSLEIIKFTRLQTIPMVVNPRGATIDSIQNAGFSLEESILTKRSIDPLLLDLNQKGYLNGHTPFSAMLAFLTLLTSRLFGIRYIALSNESSANESTVAGTNINHQYSKSYEFEKDFREYYQTYILQNQEYFSFLRPLTEIQIACLFSQFSQHHLSFRSCNAGSKENIWCGNCPKCLFTYVLLSPFIPQKKMHEIFGKALLNDENLKPILDELRGLKESKPFECVGTIDEVELALQHAQKEYREEKLMKDMTASDDEKSLNTALLEWNSVHFLPTIFTHTLKNQLTKC